MRLFPSLAALSVASLALTAMPAMAQNPQAAPPASPTAPVAPPNAPSPPPEQIAPPGGGTHGGSLSDRLSNQRGAIKPGNIDPGITVTPPSQGAANTPVLKPPGSPGGNPNVIPK